MKFYCKHVVRFTSGHPNEQFITGVPEELINADFESEKGVIKRYFPKLQKSDSNFFEDGACALGDDAYRSAFCRINTWDNNPKQVEHGHQFKSLLKKPENLCEPIQMDSESPKGLEIWRV